MSDLRANDAGDEDALAGHRGEKGRRPLHALQEFQSLPLHHLGLRALRLCGGREDIHVDAAGAAQGKNREIRKLMKSIGLEVARLIRLSYGPFQLGSLKKGEVKEVPQKVLKEQLGNKI